MNNFKTNWKNNQSKPTENGFDNRTDQPNNQTLTKPNSLITTIGQLLPFAPLVYEQFTGQKVPAVTGTMAEMQTTLISIQASLQNLNQRLLSLESSANNLTHQFQNLRLTHTKERKEIEFDRPQLEEN